MNESVILLIDAGAETNAAALTVSQNAGFDVRSVKLNRDFSELIELEKVAVVVLEYDPDVHGPAIVEGLEQWFPARPVIIISDAEGLRHPLVVPGGATRNLTKPVSVERLTHALHTIVHAPGCQCLSCDRWGHPYRAPARSREAKPDTVAA